MAGPGDFSHRIAVGVVALARHVDDVGVRVVSITSEEEAHVRRFLERRPLDVRVPRIEGAPPECFVTRGIPATFVIARDGRIAFRHVGAARWAGARVVAYLRELAIRPEL